MDSRTRFRELFSVSKDIFPVYYFFNEFLFIAFVFQFAIQKFKD